MRQAVQIAVQKEIFFIAAHFQGAAPQIGNSLARFDLPVEIVQIGKHDDGESQQRELGDGIDTENFAA